MNGWGLDRFLAYANQVLRERRPDERIFIKADVSNVTFAIDWRARAHEQSFRPMMSEIRSHHPLEDTRAVTLAASGLSLWELIERFALLSGMSVVVKGETVFLSADKTEYLCGAYPVSENFVSRVRLDGEARDYLFGPVGQTALRYAPGTNVLLVVSEIHQQDDFEKTLEQVFRNWWE
jgi:hypothetical protein